VNQPSPTYLPDPYLAASTRDPRHLRIATLNIFGHHEPWSERRSVLVEGFRYLRPDLVALQEVIRTEAYDQAADILGDDYDVVHQAQGKVDDNGIAIASRWPILQVREVDLKVTPRTAAFFASTLIAEIQAPDPIGPLLFVNHLPEYQPAFEHERELQTVLVAALLEQMVAERPLHVIVAGDLDADPDAASIRFWTGRQSLDGLSICYRDAWESTHPGEPGHTFTPENGLMTAPDWPCRRIDYIFVRSGDGGGPSLTITSCERTFIEPVNGMWGSDHYGLVADLALPPLGASQTHDD
jgi:endonuclease/exonuclease/phosphatase family metal-dependent hydrolase